MSYGQFDIQSITNHTKSMDIQQNRTIASIKYKEDRQMSNDIELLEKLIKIASAIGSPYGEGATYNSVYASKAPKLNIKREIGDSHLDDTDWKLFIEELAYLIAQEKAKAVEEFAKKLKDHRLSEEREMSYILEYVTVKDINQIFNTYLESIKK